MHKANTTRLILNYYWKEMHSTFGKLFFVLTCGNINGVQTDRVINPWKVENTVFKGGAFFFRYALSLFYWAARSIQLKGLDIQ